MKRVVIVLIITVIGLGIAHLVGMSGQNIWGWPLLFLCALWAFAVNWAAFIPAAAKQTETFYDLTGSITYISMIVLALLLSGSVDLRGLVVAALVVIWAGRLGTFLFKRVRQDKGDHRFDEIKTDPLRFLIAWTLQGLWVILTAIAALAIITTNDPQPWGIFATFGLAVWILGFGLEVIADQQKRAFRADPQNKGRFIQSGLWARSQHPNYFGEIVLWSGISIMALPVLSGWSYLALISPVFVTLLLTKVSGIPLLQKAAKQRWGDEPDFQAYQKATPILIPKLG